MTTTESAGTRFPFINLEKAIGRAKQLFDADQRGREMSVASAFAIWEYSEKSSGGHQTIAALKAYGLIDAPNAGKIVLTEGALRYFRHEDEAERKKLATQFALSPKLIRALWNEWNVTPPADTLARSHLKADRLLNDQGSRTLLTIYRDNIKFAGLKGDDTLPPSGDRSDGDNGTPAKIKVGDYVQWSPGGADQFKPVRKVEWVSEDGKFIRVFGSPTGVPVSEATVQAAPAAPVIPAAVTPDAAAKPPLKVHEPENSVSAYLIGNRVQITADVDAEGLKKLQNMLAKYAEILAML